MNELFEQKYKECEKSLYLIAVGYLHNTEDAKDCLQEAALAAYRSFDFLKHRDYFKTWMTRILINKCKDHLKKRRFTEELTDSLNVFYEIPEQEMEVVDILCKIKPEIAVYITLRFYNDMTYEEVAKALRQPVSTVKYRTKQALEIFKQQLEGEKAQ